MPVNLEDVQNPPKLPERFEQGKFLSIKSSKDKDDLLRLFDNLIGMNSIYLQESEKILPNLARLIAEGVDFRSIFFILITFKRATLAKDFLKYLEDNNIFFPIDKPYNPPHPMCPNFFAEVAALGDAGITKSLLKYGISGYKHHLDNKANIAEKDKKEKVNEFVEDLFALTPTGGKMSTLEYVISTISPVMLFTEGFSDVKNEENKDGLVEFAYSRHDDLPPKELELFYNLPWDTIKTLNEIGSQHHIDLRDSESIHLSYGNKIFDIIAKASDDKERMQKLVERLIYPYSKVRDQDIEVEINEHNSDEYYFSVDIDGMHYDNNPANVLIIMSKKSIKNRCEAILSSTPKMSADVMQRLDQQDADLRRHSFRLRSHSGNLKEHTETLEKHEKDIELLKKEAERFKETLEKLDEGLTFEKFGDNEFLKKQYVEIRDLVLKKLNSALAGDHEKQMDLMLKNGAMLAGTLDFFAGVAGVPGVIGASFSAIAYACKYVQKLKEQEISKDMQEMLLGPLNLPELIAKGVAEALTLNAQENMKVHNLKYKNGSPEEREIIKDIDSTLSRQLSGEHLKELIDLMLNPESDSNRKEKDIFKDLKEKLIDAIIAGRPVTSDLLAERNEESIQNSSVKVSRARSLFGFSYKSRKQSINHKPQTTREKVKELYQRPLTSPSLSQEEPKALRSGSDSSHSNGSSGSTSYNENKLKI